MKNIKTCLSLFFVAVGINVFPTQASATSCPFTLASDNNTSLNDAGAANCAFTINSGITLSATSTAVSMRGAGSTLTNNGTISSTGTGVQISIFSVNFDSIINTGTISTTSTGIGIYGMNSSSSIVNTINNSNIINSADLDVISNDGARITNLINTGTISTPYSYGRGVMNNSSGLISNFTNNGAIQGGSSGEGIRNRGTLTNLNNGQGGNSSNS